MENIKANFTEQQIKAYNVYVKTHYLDAMGMIDQWDNSRNIKAAQGLFEAFAHERNLTLKEITASALEDAGKLMRKAQAKEKGFSSGTKGVILTGYNVKKRQVITFHVKKYPSEFRKVKDDKAFRFFCRRYYGLDMTKPLSVTYM